MKALKAFIKPIEAPQRSVKIKIQLIFSSLSGIGTGRVNTKIFLQLTIRNLHQLSNTRLYRITDERQILIFIQAWFCSQIVKDQFFSFFSYKTYYLDQNVSSMTRGRFRSIFKCIILLFLFFTWMSIIFVTTSQPYHQSFPNAQNKAGVQENCRNVSTQQRMIVTIAIMYFQRSFAGYSYHLKIHKFV